MIIGGLYQGDDLDVIKKIKHARRVSLRCMIQSDSVAASLRLALSRLDAQRTELQKTMCDLEDIEAHFKVLCEKKEKGDQGDRR